MLRLFTTHYPEPDPARRAEYAECLSRNLGCEAIAEVRILVEGGVGADLPENPKLFTRAISARPTYADFFTWINEIAGPADLSVVGNSDIFFDHALVAVAGQLRLGECYALARWDQQADGSSRLLDRNDSQDVWIFRGKIRNELYGSFPLGVPRCDNRLLHELVAAGYRVRNPAFSIRTHHLHAGARGEYGDTGQHFVAPPYRYLWPHNLLGPIRTLWHNLRHPNARIAWCFDRRAAAQSLPMRIIRKIGKKFLCSQ